MCACMHVDVYAHMYMRVCLHIHVCVYMHVCVHARVSVLYLAWATVTLYQGSYGTRTLIQHYYYCSQTT